MTFDCKERLSHGMVRSVVGIRLSQRSVAAAAAAESTPGNRALRIRSSEFRLNPGNDPFYKKLRIAECRMHAFLSLRSAGTF
jgi:hypothetical protein